MHCRGGTIVAFEVDQTVVSPNSTRCVLDVELSEALEQRSNRLARALRRMGVKEGQTAAVVMCNDTWRLVALAAISKLGMTPVDYSCRISPVEYAISYRASGAVVTLACRDGSQMWLASGVGGLILGNGEGVRWWKLAELRESPDPLLTD
jgi:hypothetical protein